MSDRNRLSESIDRLVESAIRRILPTVMNEVLLQTIASAGVLSEERPRPVRRMKKPKRRVQRVVESRGVQPTNVQQPRRPPPTQRRVDLTEMLDDSAGSDAYEEYEARTAPRRQAREPEPDVDDGYETEPHRGAIAPPMAQRLAALDPALQAMAEGLAVSNDDGAGEMWGDEHDSAATGPTAVSEIRDVAGAAKRAGMDFSVMKRLIEKTSPAPRRIDVEDAKARAAFENQRLKRMRERLNDGKPVD